MSESKFELPAERLATTASDGSRIYLHPAEATGFFRTLRSRIYEVLLIIFIALPWIHLQGEQVLLLDIKHQRFNIFGLKFWGHDAPILFFVLLLFVVGIGLITALLGRSWCGWACPQTVFVDRIYRRIEEWIEGKSFERRKLATAPWTSQKILKKSLKWFIFTIISLIFTHSFLAYFVGSNALLGMVTRSPIEHPTAFLVIFFTTLIVLFDFGWFREQFCIIACPYGRFQSVLMDEHSLTVSYDEKRGEPRKDQTHPTDHGDCVNCYRCVQVCPTGIDIRRGTQMECIACTACIDACDEVMEKIHKPKGLIRYDRESNLKGLPVKHIRARVIIYALVFAVGFSALSFILANREMLKINFVRPAENPYQLLLPSQEILNHFKVNLRNQNWNDVNLTFELSEKIKNLGISLTIPVSPLSIPAGSSVRADLFIRFPLNQLEKFPEGLPLEIHSKKSNQDNEVLHRKVPLIGPLSSS